MSFLTNPMTSIGLGLLQSSGPSLTPRNAWGDGISAGLLLNDRARRDVEESDARKKRQKMMESQLALQTQKQQQETYRFHVEQAREAAERERFNQALSGLSPEQQAQAQLLGPEQFRAVQANRATSAELTPYQEESLKLQRAKLNKAGAPDPYKALQAQIAVNSENRAQAKFDADQAESARELEEEAMTTVQKEKAWAQQRKNGIEAADRAIVAAGKWGAAGFETNLPFAEKWKGGPRANLIAELNTIQSAVGLERLVKIKEQGGTFGALSTKELALLTDSLASLDPNQGEENLIANINRVKGLLQKSGVGDKSDGDQAVTDWARAKQSGWK